MQMMHGNGFGFNWKGLYLTSLMDHHANWRSRADELSESLKVTILAGEYILRKYQGRYYAKCQNLSRVLRAAYDSALSKFDLLLMPTLPLRATPLPGPTASKAEIVQRAWKCCLTLVRLMSPAIPLCRSLAVCPMRDQLAS